jgi:hypothetical protein
MDKNLKMGICVLDEFDIPIATRSLNATWTEDIVADLKEKFEVEFGREVSVMISDQLKLMITPDVVYDLIKESLK